MSITGPSDTAIHLGQYMTPDWAALEAKTRR